MEPGTELQHSPGPCAFPGSHTGVEKAAPPQESGEGV